MIFQPAMLVYRRIFFPDILEVGKVPRRWPFFDENPIGKSIPTRELPSTCVVGK